MSKSKSGAKSSMNAKKAVLAGIIAGCAVAAANVVIMAAVTPASAEMAAAKFCRAYQADSEWRVKLLLTDDLKDKWHEAEKRNAAIARARPDEKPPLGDGIQLGSFPDAMPECNVARISARGADKVVNINHVDPARPSANWTDRIVVRQVGNDWLIDDVIFPSHGNGLRTALNRAIKMPVPEEVQEAAAQSPAPAAPAPQAIEQAEPAAGPVEIEPGQAVHHNN